MVFILVLQYEFPLEQYLSYENISLLWFPWCFDFFDATMCEIFLSVLISK